MPTLTFELTDLEQNVLAHEARSVEDWIENLVTWQARLAQDEVVESEMTRMLADPTVTSIPPTKEAIFAAYVSSQQQ